LILLDVNLPDINGFDVCQSIREIESKTLKNEIENWTPVIFLTAYTEDHNLKRGIDVGGDDYLIKPIKPQTVKAKILAMQRILNLQKRLKQQNQKLSSMLNVFSRAITDQIRNPLASIIACSDNILRHIDKESKKNVEIATQVSVDLKTVNDYMEQRGILRNIEMMRESIFSLDSRVTGLSDIAYATYQLDEDKQVVNMTNMLHEVVDAIQTGKRLKKHKIDFDIKNIEKNSFSICTPKQIYHSLYQILENTIETLKPQKSSSITIKAHTLMDQIQIIFEDNGINANSDYYKKACVPFCSLKSDQLGIRLTIASDLIENKNGGEIEIIPLLPRGSTCAIRLPKARNLN